MDVPRTYTSRLRTDRAEQNRLSVLSSGIQVFGERGWSTTMSDVASHAGVTRQTVYQQFPNKLALLDACIVHALSDGEDKPVRTLDDYRLMEVGTIDTRLTAAARWLCGAHERSAVIQNVLDQAAATDDAAAERLRERESTRWEEVKWALGRITGTSPDDRLVDTAWILASRRNWLLLVDDKGWTPQEWTAWFIAHLRADIEGYAIAPL